MSIKTTAKEAISRLDYWRKKEWLRKYENKKINAKKSIWENYIISPADLEKIHQIYGPNADTRWHKYFASFSGKMDPYYVPEILFSTNMEWNLNPYKLCKELEDKSLLETLFGSVQYLRIPKTVICKTYGTYVGEKGDIINESDVVPLVENYFLSKGKAILKPTRDTSSGRGVVLLNKDNYRSYLSAQTDNYIVQEVVVNQDDIRNLNSSSLNTIRVMTYICNSRICTAPLLLRIGVGDSIVDNAHAGGIFVGVQNDGYLCPMAFSEYGDKCYCHPTSNIIYEGYRIAGIDRILNAAVNCHKCLPQLGMVSWDFTLDEKETVTLIEANLFGHSIWLPQIAHGKGIFEDNTIEMLKKLD